MSIKSISDELVQLGFKPKCFRTLAEAKLALAAAKAGKAVKPSYSKPQLTIRKPASVAAVLPCEIAELKAIAKAAKSANAKVDAYSALRAKLEANLKAEQDPTRQAEIFRDLKSVLKSEAYSLLALKNSDPQATSIRNLLNKADE